MASCSARWFTLHGFVGGHQVPVNVFDLRDRGDDLLAEDDVGDLAVIAGDANLAQVGIEAETLQQVLPQLETETGVSCGVTSEKSELVVT